MIMTHELDKMEEQLTDMNQRLRDLEELVEDYTKGLPAVTEDDMITLIRDAIKDMGMSQGQLAEIMGYSRPTISMMIHGRRRMPLEVMMKFLEIIGWKLVAVPVELPFTPEGE